jgi:hypothetical protein
MRLERRASVLATGLLLALFVAAVHWAVLIGGQTFVQRDALTYLWPSRELLAAALRQGRLPEWNDFIALGQPFAANPINGVAYPPAWLGAVLPVSFATDLVILLHLLAGALGTGLLARRLGARTAGATFAGAAFAASGYVATMLVNDNAQLLAWTPWTAWAADRLAAAAGRRERLGALLAFAAAFGLQLAVGEPAHIVTAGLLALLLAATASRPAAALGWLGAGTVAAAGLAAASLLPAVGLLGWSDRAGGVAPALAEAWSTPPIRLVELLWPHVLGDASAAGNLGRLVADASGWSGGGTSGPNWAFSLYVGTPVLLLAHSRAAEGRRERWLLAGALIFVLLALGTYSPVQPLFRAVFAPERLARYPEKHLLGAVVLWAALAGAGFERLLERGPGRPLLAAAAATLGLLAAGAGALWATRGLLAEALAPGAAALQPAVDPSAGLAISLGGGGMAVAAAAAFLAALWLRRRGDRWSAAASALAAAAALAPMVSNGALLTPTAPRSLVDRPPSVLGPAMAHPRSDGLRTRLYLGYTRPAATDYASGEALGLATVERAYANLPGRWGFACLPGADSAFSGPMARFQGLSDTMSARRYARLLGLDLVLVQSEFADPFGWDALAESPVGTTLLRVEDQRPRAFVASRWSRATVEEALAELAAPGRDADLARVVLEGAGRAPPPGGEREPLRPCQVRSDRPEQVELLCGSPAGGYAVLLDEPAPGWTATVDGQPARIERADGLFRAVAIGPGWHRVAFSYSTPGLLLGAVVSLASLAAWLAAVLVLRRRRSPRPDASS